MKKIFTLILALVAVASSAMALEYEPESGLTYQAQFGMNISNFRGTAIGTDPKPGFNLGVRAEYMLPGCAGVYLNAGALYGMKGAQVDAIGGTLKARACYAEIPIHVGFRYNVIEDLGLYADFGPYFAIGTNGKSLMDYDDDAMDDIKTRFFRKDDGDFGDIQRFDFGLGFRVGAEYINHHSLTVGMDWGITDMYTDDYRKAFKIQYGVALTPMKNFNASISYAYRF